MLISYLLKRPLVGLFLFLVFSDIVITNGASNPKIIMIEIKGNVKTLDYIIEREIKHKILIPLDSVLAEEDRDRIENLGLFSEVQWRMVLLENNAAKLVYNVVESVQNIPPTILPAYDEKTGWSIIGGIFMTNWRGRNQSLSFNISVGGKDTYGLVFSDPWKFGNHVSMKIQIDKSIYDHNFLDYNIEKNIGRIDFGRWYGENIKLIMGTSIESKEFKNELFPKNKYFYFSIKPVIKYDTRDVYWNPTKGVLWSNYYVFNSGISFSNFSWKKSISLYHQLIKSRKELIVAINGTFKFVWGDKEETWLNYLGDSFTVRGWKLPNRDLFDSKSESYRFGHELIHGSFELRKVIIPKFITKYDTEFGLIGVFFIDSGLISDEIKNINNDLIMVGSGFGLRIPFPLINLIRLDYGWGYNKKWNFGSFHWGISHKF